MAHASFIIDTNQVYYLCLHTLWFLHLVLCLARCYAVMKSTHPNRPVKTFWIVSDFYWSYVFIFILFSAIAVLVTVKDNPLCWGTKEKENTAFFCMNLFHSQLLWNCYSDCFSLLAGACLVSYDWTCIWAGMTPAHWHCSHSTVAILSTI